MLQPMGKSSALFGVVVLAAISPAWAQPCSEGSIAKSAGQVHAIQSQLLAVNVGDHGMDTNVGPTTQTAIHALKDAIGETVDAFMRCESPSLDAAGVQTRLAALLKANLAQKPESYAAGSWPETIDQVYGSDLKIRSTILQNDPAVIAVQTTFGIDCGEDNQLFAYEAQRGEWHRELVWQSANYNSIGEAFGDFFLYRLVPSTLAPGWVLAVAHGHPWCSSNLSAFDIDVLRPDSPASPQRVLFHANEVYRRDEDIKMSSVLGGVELRLITDSMDAGILTRSAIYRYRVAGSNSERVQPIANNGRDFVDGWLQAPWAQAVQWSAPSAIAILQQEHARIQKTWNTVSDDSPMLNYGPVLRCSDRKDHFQIEFDENQFKQQQTILLRATYFQIQQGSNSFIMLSASPKPNPHCKGGDLMQARSDP